VLVLTVIVLDIFVQIISFFGHYAVNTQVMHYYY